MHSHGLHECNKAPNCHGSIDCIRVHSGILLFKYGWHPTVQCEPRLHVKKALSHQTSTISSWKNWEFSQWSCMFSPQTDSSSSFFHSHGSKPLAWHTSKGWFHAISANYPNCPQPEIWICGLLREFADFCGEFADFCGVVFSHFFWKLHSYNPKTTDSEALQWHMGIWATHWSRLGQAPCQVSPAQVASFQGQTCNIVSCTYSNLQDVHLPKDPQEPYFRIALCQTCQCPHAAFGAAVAEVSTISWCSWDRRPALRDRPWSHGFQITQGTHVEMI